MTKVLTHLLTHSSIHSLTHSLAHSPGMTLLHFAVDRGHVDMTKLLLQAGADRSIADKDGMTPLDYATICEYDTLVALLSE